MEEKHIQRLEVRPKNIQSKRHRYHETLSVFCSMAKLSIYAVIGRFLAMFAKKQQQRYNANSTHTHTRITRASCA